MTIAHNNGQRVNYDDDFFKNRKPKRKEAAKRANRKLSTHPNLDPNLILHLILKKRLWHILKQRGVPV